MLYFFTSFAQLDNLGQWDWRSSKPYIISSVKSYWHINIVIIISKETCINAIVQYDLSNYILNWKMKFMKNKVYVMLCYVLCYYIISCCWVAIFILIFLICALKCYINSSSHHRLLTSRINSTRSLGLKASSKRPFRCFFEREWFDTM